MKENRRPNKHTHYTNITTALLLLGAIDPPPGGNELPLERQYMRRKGRRLSIGTPEINTKDENVVMREGIEEINEENLRRTERTIHNLRREVIPLTITGPKGQKKYTDKSRFIAGETVASAKAVVMRTERRLVNQDKERNRRMNQRAHIETIDRRKWSEKKARMWDEPYKCKLSADSLVAIATDTAGEERSTKFR